MRVFLDDERQEPAGFFRTYTVNATRALLLNAPERLTELSLDNDLGLYDPDGGEGMQVPRMLVWYDAAGYPLWPETLVVHTANNIARDDMDSPQVRQAYTDRHAAPELTFSKPQAAFARPEVLAWSAENQLHVNFTIREQMRQQETLESFGVLATYHLRQGDAFSINGLSITGTDDGQFLLASSTEPADLQTVLLRAASQ